MDCTLVNYVHDTDGQESDAQAFAVILRQVAFKNCLTYLKLKEYDENMAKNETEIIELRKSLDQKTNEFENISEQNQKVIFLIYFSK